MSFIKPVRSAPTETVEDAQTGEPVQVIEHFSQGDSHYRIVHNLKAAQPPEDDGQKPCRIFSKLALESALFAEGLLEPVDAFIDSLIITNEFGQTMPLRRLYDTALEFSEDHPDFARVLAGLKESLSISDEKAEEILSASVKEVVPPPEEIVIPEDENQTPYRTFSKLLLESKLFAEGVLDTVDAFIDSQTITNEHGQTMPLRRKYETALDFTENHPLFKPAVKEIQNLLDWTDEKAEEVLSASEKEDF